jgi:hypothetical protein
MRRATRLQWLGAYLACAVVCAYTNDEVQAAPPRQLTLRLRMAPQYIVGLPFFVEVTLSNDTESATYYDLLTCNPDSPPFPVELTCSAGGKAVRLPAESAGGHDERLTRGHVARRRGFTLLPGEARTFVLDLSELEPRLKPGAWSCRARWVMEHERPLSKTVPVTLTAAARGDMPLVARLRSAGGVRTPAWINLIEARGLDAEAMRGLSAQARRALVPYLIVREAVQGPEPLASFPLDGLTAEAAAGPWASEASVLAYELRWARRAPDLAQQRTALLKRWPGLQFRVKEIEAGVGRLATLRRQYGAERSDR